MIPSLFRSAIYLIINLLLNLFIYSIIDNKLSSPRNNSETTQHHPRPHSSTAVNLLQKPYGQDQHPLSVKRRNTLKGSLNNSTNDSKSPK